MENYGNYQRQPAAPHITWSHSNGTNVTNGVGFSQAARKLCNHSTSEFTRDSLYKIPAAFLVLFASGNALDAWSYACRLLRRDMPPEEVTLNLRLHANIIEFMKDLPGMENYQHFSNVSDLFMAWLIAKKDPVCASEILMDRLAKTTDASLEEIKRSGKAPGGPMLSEVTAHLATDLDGNRNISVADLRMRYPDSRAVQQWLDTVQDILS